MIVNNILQVVVEKDFSFSSKLSSGESLFSVIAKPFGWMNNQLKRLAKLKQRLHHCTKQEREALKLGQN